MSVRCGNTWILTTDRIMEEKVMLSARGDSVISYVIIITHLIMTASPSQVLTAASQDGVIKETSHYSNSC